MRRINYFLFLAFGLGILASCSKNENPTPNPSDPSLVNGEKNLVVALSGLNTRATDPVDVLGAASDPDVTNLVIFVTDADDEIIRKVEITADAVADSDWDKITDASKGLMIPNVGAGAVAVSVYGNYKTNTKTYVTGGIGDEITVATTMADQQGTAVLYAGSDAALSFDIDVVPIYEDVVSYTATTEIEIAPIVSRIQIKSITFVESGDEEVTNSAGTADVEWDNFAGDLIGIYMNNFYNAYPIVAASTLSYNAAAATSITGGTWMFGATDAAEYASYNLWDGTDTYEPYDLTAFNADADVCFAFNFFPSGDADEQPYLHFNLANVGVADPATDISSSDPAVFNPLLLPQAAFSSVINFTKGSPATDVVFEAGKIYNVNIAIKPYFTHSDLIPQIYNIILTVDILPWGVEDIDPVFQQQ